MNLRFLASYILTYFAFLQNTKWVVLMFCYSSYLFFPDHCVLPLAELFILHGYPKQTELTQLGRLGRRVKWLSVQSQQFFMFLSQGKHELLPRGLLPARYQSSPSDHYFALFNYVFVDCMHFDCLAQFTTRSRQFWCYWKKSSKTCPKLRHHSWFPMLATQNYSIRSLKILSLSCPHYALKKQTYSNFSLVDLGPFVSSCELFWKWRTN